MSSQQGQLRIAAPKPVYSALHHRSFVLQDVRVEGELAASGEPREPEPSGEPTRTSASSFSLSSDSTPVIAFHQNQQPPGSFQQQQLPVIPASQQPEMIQSHPPHPPSSHSHSPSLMSSRTHNLPPSSTSFAKSRIGSKTPPALFNPSAMDASSTTRQGQIKSQSLGYAAPSPPLSGGRPLPAVPLASQDSTGSSRSWKTNASHVSYRSATDPVTTSGAGFDMSTSPRSSASHGSSTSSASSKSSHTHLSLPTTSRRTETPPSLISTASGSSTAFPMPSEINGDKASKANNGGRGGNTIHGTHAQQSAHTQGTYSYAFHQNQNRSTSSSSSSSVLFGSAALSSPAFVSSPPALSSPPPPPPPPPSAVAMTATPGHVPSASLAMISTMTKSGGTSMEGAGSWSVSRDGRGSNPNSSTAVNNSNNSNSSKISSANNSSGSNNSNTAPVRPLPLPPGSTPRARTRSNNASTVLGGPPGPHTSSVNVLALPISWASRPVDLNRTVPVCASHAGNSGGEHQQHTLQQHQFQQPGQQIQQGQGQQQKPYSRPSSRPSLRPSLPSSRPSSRPSSPSSPPPRPPSNLAFGPATSSTSAGAGAANAGAGRSSSPPPRSKTITSTTRSTARGGRMRSRSTSRPKTQVPAGAAGVLRFESFSGVGVAMGTSAAAPAMTSPTAPPNTAPPQARLAPQGSRIITSSRKRSVTESLDSPLSVTITKSQPVGSGLTTATNTTTSQPMARQTSKRAAIPPRSTPPQSQLPSPPSVSHHHGGHASSSGLTPGHNTSLLTTPTPPTHITTQTGGSSGNKRHQGGVQLSRQLVSRAAAVPAPLNPNYNCVSVGRGGVYYVRDKDPYPYHQKRQDEKGKDSETDASASITTTLVTKRPFPVRPLPKPTVQPLSSDKQSAVEDLAGIDADAEDGGKPTIDDKDDDDISCLEYIDSPDSIIGVHPDLGDDMGLSDEEGGREDPLLVYIDDNFDSSEEDEPFVKSVSPMRYARPGSDGTVDSADDGGSDLSSDFFSDVDDPYKYNKGRSKRRGRTRTTVPVGLGGASGSSNETAGVGAGGSQSQKAATEKLGIRMTGSLGSMRDLIESKAAKEKRKKEAADADAGGGGIPARTKSAERDRALPQRYGHPQESPLPPPPPRLMWFAHTQVNSSKVSLNEGVVGAEEGAVASIGGGGGDKVISPVSLSSSQGGRSLSPMRYAKRMSVELLDDSSSLGSPISPIGVGGLLKGKHARLGSEKKKKKRSQPWSYQFDYQAAKASSPFTFGMGGEKAAADVEGKEPSRKEEEKKKAEEAKKRDKAKSLRGFKTKEGSEGRKKLSIDVLDISLLRRSSQPTLLGPSDAGAGGDDVFGLGSSGSGGGSGGSGQQTFRTWDDSPASSATASSFTVIAAPGANNPVVSTPPAHSSPPPIATTTPPSGASSTGTVGRTRTFKVRNP